MPFLIRPFRRFPVQYSVTYNAGSFIKFSLAFCLGFWLLITLLMLSSGSVHAEWEALVENEEVGMTVYVDPATIRRAGDLVSMWQLFDYKTIQTVAGELVVSSKVHSEYDCFEERSRRLAFTDHSGKMGRGEAAISDSNKGEWQPVAPESMGQHLWRFACSKK
ncbi:MAG: surface-adhesin E family protein [Nitrospirota bacterium]